MKMPWHRAVILVAATVAVVVCVLHFVICPMTPLDEAIWRIQAKRMNCLDAALAIGAAYKAEGLNSRVVIAWGLEGWHAFVRMGGELVDTGPATVLATPQFEFEYVEGMKAVQNRPKVTITFEGARIVYECSDGWPEYAILEGARYVTILEESEND